MVDHAARIAVRAAVEEYFADRITAFEFDERLRQIETDDATVREVVFSLWCLYDDVIDHHVVGDKPAWDYVQRLLLLLDSGAELTVDQRRRFHVSQAVAIGLLGLMATAYRAYPQLWLPPLMIGGVASIFLSAWRRRFVESLAPPDPWRCAPFPTLGSLRAALRRVPTFRKAAYRVEIGPRRIRSAASSILARIPSYWSWLLFSPVVLLVQAFPCRISQTDVAWRSSCASV